MSGHAQGPFPQVFLAKDPKKSRRDLRKRNLKTRAGAHLRPILKMPKCPFGHRTPSTFTTNHKWVVGTTSLSEDNVLSISYTGQQQDDINTITTIAALAARARLACTGQHTRTARCTCAPARAALPSSACPPLHLRHAWRCVAPRSPAGAAPAEAAAAAAPPASSCSGALLQQVQPAPATRSQGA